MQLLQVFKINICAFARMIERGKKGVLAMKAKLCGMKTREAAEAAEAAGAARTRLPARVAAARAVERRRLKRIR